MKSAIVCFVIAAVFVYVSAMPADGNAVTPAQTAAPNAATTAIATPTAPAGQVATAAPSDSTPLNFIDQGVKLAKNFMDVGTDSIKKMFDVSSFVKII